jgi:hypothetical protein
MIFGAMPIPAVQFEAAPHARFVVFLFFMSAYLLLVATIKELLANRQATSSKLL